MGITIENFFEIDSQKYHEIMFVHKAEFINEEDKKIETTIQQIKQDFFFEVLLFV